MFTTIRHGLNQFLNKSRTIKNEPLNKVSLIVVILVDIFILVNVFTGLNDISQWPISPSQSYPCYNEWERYQNQNFPNKHYEILRQAISVNTDRKNSLEEVFRQGEKGHLGNVNQVCLTYAEYQDKVNYSDNQRIISSIDQTNLKVNNLEQANQTIRSEYDSTLLEKIAGQTSDKSINQTSAEKARQQLTENDLKITTLRQEIKDLKQQLLNKPESIKFINFLNEKESFNRVKQGHANAAFWYPSIQFFFQALFLVPLIAIALLVHNSAQKKGYGLIALISWHLLVISLIPLILKVFEFLQIGFIFQLLFDFIQAIFGGLLFIISYLYILVIPLIGFGIIKFFQTIVFNPKGQAANRFQKSRCVGCAKKIRPQDPYCPHCGEYQYVDCGNCHQLTYKHLSYCKHCGTSQEVIFSATSEEG
jgi:ABC-type multidrug transport system fused ATPase/permease subunit